MSVAVTELPALCLVCEPARGQLGEGVVLVGRRVSSSNRVRYYLQYREQQSTDERYHESIAGL